MQEEPLSNFLCVCDSSITKVTKVLLRDGSLFGKDEMAGSDRAGMTGTTGLAVVSERKGLR